jgi:hypothetical protein
MVPREESFTYLRVNIHKSHTMDEALLTLQSWTVTTGATLPPVLFISLNRFSQHPTAGDCEQISSYLEFQPNRICPNSLVSPGRSELFVVQRIGERPLPEDQFMSPISDRRPINGTSLTIRLWDLRVPSSQFAITVGPLPRRERTCWSMTGSTTLRGFSRKSPERSLQFVSDVSL